MKLWKRILSAALSVSMMLGLLVGAAAIEATAVTTTYQLKSLLAEGKIKPLGRSQANSAGTGITADWSGAGFEVNVNATGGKFTVGYSASYQSWWVVHVDDVQVWRGLAASGSGSFTVDIPVGSHKISVIKETQISSTTTAYWDLTTVSFAGTITAAPAKSDLYIEFVGDSYSCGDGALGIYRAGHSWWAVDDSATHGFPWYTAKALGADYSLVSRGGIGLFDGKSEQEATVNKVTMADIYSYTSGYRSSEGAYGFSRKPDVVVVELGANDGIDNADSYKSISAWAGKLEAFIDQVRAKNGAGTKIVMLSHNATKYFEMLKLVERRQTTDPNLFACHFSHNGNGSAALNYQAEGHPDYVDHQAIADALVKFMKNNDVVSSAAAPTTSYKDITYYVSASGSDSNSGTAADAPKATIRGALEVAEKAEYAANERIVLQVTGAVVASPGQLFGATDTIYNTAGKRVPILITTKDYNGSNAAELQVTFKPSNGGSCAMYSCNDYYFKNLTIKSYTSGEFCVNHFYSSGSDITFDNVSLITDKQCNYMTWIVSTDNFATGANILKALTKDVYSTITFRNGDYTGVYRVSVVEGNYIWSSSGNYEALPYFHGRIVIDDGAKMGNVYGMYGDLAVASATVEMRGGSVNAYYATSSGASGAVKTFTGDLTTILNGTKLGNSLYYGSGDYVTINGNVVNTFAKGRFIGRQFNGLGNNVTLNGDLTNNVTGGEIRIHPTNTNQDDGVYLGGHNHVTINGNLTNNISGGDINLIYNAAVDSGIYLGTRAGGKITGNLTNHITGGNLCTINSAAKATSNGIYLGMYSGNIHGTLKNNIISGTLDTSVSGGGINFGDRTVNNLIGKMENVIGSENHGTAPRFFGSGISLGGGWAQLGVNTVERVTPGIEKCSDTVVLKNTIYDAYFSGAVYGGVNGGITEANGWYSYTIGSVQTDIYGGKFNGGFYGNAACPVYGHVTSNIYGGFFTNVYGAQNGNVYDGVELNIYDMEEYYPVADNNPNVTSVNYGIWAGGTSGNISAKTSGRAAVSLSIAPEKAADLVLKTPIYAKSNGTGTITGTVSVKVKAGTFPKGFQVYGLTVGAALAQGSSVYSSETGKAVSYDSGSASVSGAVSVRGTNEPQEYVYYVSSSGSDSNAGTTPATAKKTFVSVFDQIISSNGGHSLPVGSAVTIYVSGTVVNHGGSSQTIGGNQVLTQGTTGKHVPITVTTYNYTGSRATILVDNLATNDGQTSTSVVNDIIFKDIIVKSVTNTSTGFCSHKLYAAGCSIVLDNATFTTDGKGHNNTSYENNTLWVISADHYMAVGFDPLNTAFHPHKGTVTFRNGIYMDLARAAAVNSNNIWRSEDKGGSVYSVPEMSTQIIVDKGAMMGTVYGTYGTLGMGSATVEIKDGLVERYLGTGSNASKPYATKLTATVSGGTVNSYAGCGDGVTINADIINNLSGGVIGGSQYVALGNSVTMSGNLTNNISGGKLVILPTHQGQDHGIFLSGRNSVSITGNVENNITGGELGVIYNIPNVQAGIYFGGRNGGVITGNLTNHISGGSFYTRAARATPKYASMHFGHFIGIITGTLTNHLSGGTYEIASGNYYMGHQGVQSSSNKIVNIFGKKDSTEGPVFTTTHSIPLGGGWGRLGVTSNIGTLPTANSDTVALSNTFYGGTFPGKVLAGINSATGANVTYIKGSVMTDVYGGSFDSFYGGNNAPVYGKVTSNIHGGTFNAIYGAGNGNVYDGVELNIYAMAEGDAPAGIWAGPGSGTVSAATSGRDALKLNIAPDSADKLILRMPISSGAYGTGSVNGNTKVTVSGGTYTNGFCVDGVTVAEALAEGYACYDAGGNIITIDSSTVNTGKHTEIKPKFPDAITSDTLTITGSIIEDVPCGTTAAQLLAMLNESEHIRIFGSSGELASNAEVKAGMTVKLMNGEAVVTVLTVQIRHIWEQNAVFDWNDDYTACTATKDCINGDAQTEGEVTVTSTNSQYKASVAFEDDSTDEDVVARYAVTVEGGMPSKAYAAAGETITLLPNEAPEGQAFKGWTSAVTIANNAFTMPASAVTVTAVFGAVVDRITSDTYAVAEEIIRKIPLGTTVDELIAGINEKDYIRVFKGDTEVTGTQVVCTGMVVKLLNGQTELDSVTVMVTGDINGDGKANIADMLSIKSHLLHKSSLEGIKFSAGDINGDGKLNITDFILTKAYILKKGNITAR